ncbi:MAG: hypothetical protein AB7Q97_13875 [Gammaproteobacteria bacterium]
MRDLQAPCGTALLFALLLCAPQPAAAATVVFEFTGTCTALRNADCAAFGLAVGDAVSGGFQVDASLGQPGAVSLLDNDQYLFKFTFGNQTFTQEDSISKFGFNVSADGASISSIVGAFRNANGAELKALTIITVNVALGQSEADTFTFTDTIGKGWKLADDSSLFVDPVPLPAGGWLLASALLGLGGLHSRLRTWPATFAWRRIRRALPQAQAEGIDRI